MPSYTRNTSSITISTENSSTITNLRSAIKSGSIIRGSHMRSLRDLVNSIRRHTHRYNDEILRSTFGNTGSNSSVNRTTKASNVAAVNIADNDLRTGSLVRASHYNLLKDSYNGLIGHTHDYLDRY